jgi:hypothetical protein
MSDLDADALRSAIRSEFAPLLDRLTVIAERLAMRPHLEFLRTRETAQAVIVGLRKHANPPKPHEGLMAPRGEPGRPLL